MELRLKEIDTKEVKRKINRKNSFTDFTSLFFAIAVIFGVAIFFIILSYAYSQIQPKINEGLTSSVTPEEGKNVTEILQQTDSSIGRINVLFPLLLIGVFGFVLVTALLGQSHPVFFFIGLIVLGVALILAAIYSNFYETLTDNNDFTSTADKFNIMGLFLDNLPSVVLVIFVAIGVILYIKSGGSQGM